MAEPRKIFRIEETTAAWLHHRANGAPGALRHAAIGPAVKASAATAPAARPAKAQTAGRGQAALLGFEAAHLTRIAHELDAVVNGTEKATQKVLIAAEEIDQIANNLSAALKGKIEQGLAQDIQDIVIRVFEACNFQDLIGQRVTKVMAILKLIEDHISRVIEEIEHPQPGPALSETEQYLHGPRLEIDRGHVTQAEVDVMFSD